MHNSLQNSHVLFVVRHFSINSLEKLNKIIIDTVVTQPNKRKQMAITKRDFSTHAQQRTP